jgi:hypothetical protein
LAVIGAVRWILLQPTEEIAAHSAVHLAVHCIFWQFAFSIPASAKTVLRAFDSGFIYFPFPADSISAVIAVHRTGGNTIHKALTILAYSISTDTLVRRGDKCKRTAVQRAGI